MGVTYALSWKAAGKTKSAWRAKTKRRVDNCYALDKITKVYRDVCYGLLWRSATSRSRVRIEGWQAKPASRKRDPLRTRQWASMLTDHQEGAANDQKKAWTPPDARERGAGAQEGKGKGVMIGSDRRRRERWEQMGHRRVLG